MAPHKIHLDLYTVTGPSWGDITAEAIDHLEQAIRELPVFGEEPDQYTIAGVTRVEDVIGGFFVVQYQREVLEYDKSKRERRTNRAEWEKTVFALFPRIGSVLLQSQLYPKGLTRDRVFELFKNTMSDVMRRARLSNTTLITESQSQEVPNEQFIRVFDEPSNRVEKLVVRELKPNPDLTGLTYYNPQRDRNKIIGESHSHDFGIIDRLNLETNKERSNLREAHFAKSAVRSGNNEEIHYTATATGQRHVLRKTIKINYEINIDTDVDTMLEEDVRRMAEHVLEQFGLYRRPILPNVPPGQSTIFDILGEGQ